ncbi:hypothetical protein GT347_25090 [Xylophilus rhododendri]|uniref:Uncharacterized protein n=1 Tax=Xylophilus rhododendri TaxID=2697032 RepID=A0A857JAE9_9BURK|nr:hypothetical protein [Xylophilus rhododendri]QHJ00975.1 hypothetical protein GT347_25090 [Xylophilus rhododendri]
MERLLVIKLDAVGCEAEAWINGIAVARVDAARPRAIVPVHEYTIAGANRLELVVWPRPAAAPPDQALPPPLALKADGLQSARLAILLPRAGNAADESASRCLAQLDWAPVAGLPYEAPVSVTQDVALPVSFPRWRWLDAPLAEPTPALAAQALALLQNLARDLAEGNIESFVGAARLRTDELAAAYQVPVDESTERLRRHLASLADGGPPAFLPLDAGSLFLRKLAGGRLLECLDASGEAALRTAPDAAGTSRSFPVRLAAVEGKLYVLR